MILFAAPLMMKSVQHGKVGLEPLDYEGAQPSTLTQAHKLVGCFSDTLILFVAHLRPHRMRCDSFFELNDATETETLLTARRKANCAFQYPRRRSITASQVRVCHNRHVSIGDDTRRLQSAALLWSRFNQVYRDGRWQGRHASSETHPIPITSSVLF